MDSLGDNQKASVDNGDSIVVTKSKPFLVRPDMESVDGFYFLSNLDQYMNLIVEMLFYFKADERSTGHIATQVFTSALAKVLVHFYPLAGILKTDSDGKLIVNLAGEGVPFVEATADFEMDVIGVMGIRDPVILAKFAHGFPEATSTLEIPLLTLQVTRFKCGGYILGVALNHCICDVPVITDFVKLWADTTIGLSSTVTPFLERELLRARQPPKIEFPHNEYSVLDVAPDAVTHFEEEELLFKSFCFTPEKLAHLKEIAMKDGLIKKCTSFTVLTAFTWRARTQTLKIKPQQQTKLLFPVDVRSKFSPPLPKGYFGNGIILIHCICTAGELIEKPLSFAVKLIQEAIEAVTDKYIRSSIDYLEVNRPVITLTEATFLISTWTRLPYEAIDFGGGELTQIAPVILPKNLALYLPPGRNKEGISLLLGLPAPAMKIFQELINM